MRRRTLVKYLAFLARALSAVVMGLREPRRLDGDSRRTSLEHIDRAVDLGKQHGIHINIPFHRIPGYCINILNALNFMLGVHPGENPSSLAPGVDARSATVAYGLNRADWTYTPGGVVSWTALIRADYPD